MDDKNVLVIGSNRAGLRAARDLADAGLGTNLVESGAFLIRDNETLDCNYLENTHQLEVLKDPRIKVWTNTEVREFCQDSQGLLINLNSAPRYVDLAKCTACGDCVEACPVTIPETGLKAIHFGGQPDCAVIEKAGISPCSDACPAGIHVQGYVALINQGQYHQAYQLIQDDLPFPSVCGRVCNHVCETACTRAQLDEAVNLMALKRFVADWSFDRRHEFGERSDDKIDDELGGKKTGKRVAVIGAGPAGLTAAQDLVRLGHDVKVFDANPEPGGMMRVGIPPHRLDYQHLSWEIDQILNDGVELQLNTWVDDIPGLIDEGFDAVLAAAGASKALKPPLENADHKDNWLSLDFLKDVSLNKKIDLTGRRVIVLGGGDVAMDAARAALRLGPEKVKIICRGLRASAHELNAVEMEGIEILRNRVFQKIELKGIKIIGVGCQEAEVGEVVGGIRKFKVIPDSEHLVTGDLVIWALGQRPDNTFLPQKTGLIEEEKWVIKTDQGGKTPLDRLFAAGDFRLGATSFVVDAVGEGHRVAQSIHRYLMGNEDDSKRTARDVVLLSPDEMKARLEGRKKARSQRRPIPVLPIIDRQNNFQEVDLALEEKDVLLESNRCLICGPCSECMECVEVCEPGAIQHREHIFQTSLSVQAVIAPEGSDIGEDLPGVIHYSIGDEISGSAAAFHVLKGTRVENHGPKPACHSRNNIGRRVGVVVCQCADQISRHVNTSRVCRQALSWPEVDFAAEIRVSCSPEGGNELKRIIRENDLGKLILAACSCCSLDQVCYSCTYQRTRCKENLGIFSHLEPMAQIEFVNIREQCAWVHSRSRKKATSAALDLVRTALGRIPSSRLALSNQAWNGYQVLILGGGESASICRESLRTLGVKADMLEVPPEIVTRTGGKYRFRGLDGGILADGLVLAPGSRAELEHILGSVVIANQSPILSGDFHTDGSPAHGLMICPPETDPGISGRGTAARIFAWLQRTYSQDKFRSAFVDQARCRACGTCVEICGFGIPLLAENETGSHAEINPYLCMDCGLCTAHCPSDAIQPGTDQTEELDQILELVLS